MGEIVRREEAEKRIVAFFNNKKAQDQIGAALPKLGVTPATFARWCMTALRRNPDLMTKNFPSLIGAMVQSAQLGLDPSGVTGQSYLVPFGQEVTLLPGYRGLIALAYRGGQIAAIDAHVVYEHDSFDYEYGTSGFVRHKPAKGERGKLRAAYAVAKIKGGETVFEVMEADDIRKVKASSASARSKSSPWNDPNSEPEMWRKCPIRRLCKRLPLSTEAAQAVSVSGDDERGEPQIVSVTDFELWDAPADPTPEEQAAIKAQELAEAERDRK